MKNGKKVLKNIIELNLRPKLPSWHFVIEPVISYDKFIDDLVLYENYPSCIFMKINKNVKKWGKTWEKSISLQGIEYVIRPILHPWTDYQGC